MDDQDPSVDELKEIEDVDENSGNDGNMPEGDIPPENTDPSAPPENEAPDGM